jgi:phosphate acyltransferase
MEHNRVTIAIDAMGGDRGIHLVIPAAMRALKLHENLNLILVGQEDAIRAKLRSRKYMNCLQSGRLRIQHASEVVEMDEPVAQALRYKKDSSMRVALNLVKNGCAQACVSAGNTGALMATARFVLKMLPGIDRPAISGTIPSPNAHGFVRMLDLGANLECSADQLFEFAVIGSVISEDVDNVVKPRIALLNVGEEDIKGNEQIKAAATMLSDIDGINYVGFVEGNDIYRNVADVIVCDGFIGNVALKTSEGLARYIRTMIQDTFTHTWWARIMALFALPVLKILRKKLTPARYNGASFAGLRGSVIKSHGGTSVAGFVKAIDRAVREVEHDVPRKIGDRVQHFLAERVTADTAVEG